MFDSCTVLVARYSPLYPTKEPDSYIVGFSITHNTNKRILYKEIRLYYKELQSYGSLITDEKVLNIAWERLCPACKVWLSDVSQQGPIVGSTFIPSS